MDAITIPARRTTILYKQPVNKSTKIATKAQKEHLPFVRHIQMIPHGYTCHALNQTSCYSAF